MTVSNTSNKITYNGNGTTDLWSFSFPLGDPPHPEWVEVYLTDPNGAVAKLTKDYTIDTNAKVVKYPGWTTGSEPPPAQQPPKLPTGWKITLLRNVPLLQETSFRNQGTFSAVVVEAAMDRLTMICQQLEEKSARSIQVPVDNQTPTSEIISHILTAEANSISAANTATSKATEATNAAGMASTAATTATNAASSASDNANTASTAATTATNAALSASANANTASTAATTATNAAGTASTAASTAMSKATDAAASAAAAQAAAGYTVLPDHIISGGKVAGVGGLTVTHGAIEALISRTYVKRDAGDQQTVQAKRHGLLTFDKTGTRGIRYADDPTTFIDNNTVALWKPDGSASCPNLAVGISSIAVANNLTKTGTVNAVDGIFGGNAAQGDGSTGFYVSANSTGFPGATAEKHFDCPVTINSIAGSSNLPFFGVGDAATAVFAPFLVGARLKVYTYSTVQDTSFDVEVGKTYLISLAHDGTTVRLSVNGQQVYSVAFGAVFSAMTNLYLFKWLNGSFALSPNTIHYIEVRNACRAQQQIAEIANKLCLPNSYDDVAAGKRKNITATLPVDTHSVVYFRSGASAVLSYNDADWQYGRREKAFGGNRRVRLTPKQLNGTTALSWSNPFATRRVKALYTWAQDANGTNETDVNYVYYSSAWYGLNTANGSPAQRLAVLPQPGGVVYFNGANQTTGYIIPYVEVLEDD